MKPGNIALAVVGGTALFALALLLVRVGGAADHELPPEAAAKARARYQATASTRPRAAARPAPAPTPTPRRSLAPEPAAERPEPEPPPVEPARPRTKRALLASKRRNKGWGTGSPKLGSAELSDKIKEARGSYDDGSYEEARRLALEVLEVAPKHVRMLRLVVTASCLLGDPQQAREYIDRLPQRGQQQMRTECKKYGQEL